MKVNFCPCANQKPQNFKGIYLVQIPQKAFLNPQNEEKCLKTVRDILLYSLRVNQSKVSGNKIPYIPNSNIVFQHQTFSHALLNAGLKKNEFSPSVQWVRDNTEIPVTSSIKENYHSFFIYTKHNAVDVLKKIRLVQKNAQASELDKQYKDSIMEDVHKQALLGFEIDKNLENYYKRAQRYVIETLTQLNEVALKIRKNDIL